MCDTLVALSNATKDNSVIFAKNSDREPNEPQIMLRIPGRMNEKGKKVKCTYVEVEQRELTNEVILIKPHWMWGAEMGINDKGLVIGNEAVFTKEKLEPEALLGMDMLRLALESCERAIDAVHYIVHLLERYGQGGKAGYTENLRYHNSFIIADSKDAYVLETAAKNWAVKHINDIYTISNSLSIRNDFDGCSSGLIENAIRKRWCKSKEDFSFKSCYEDQLYSFAAKGDYRQSYTESSLRNNAGKIDVNCMMSILRSHCDNDKVKNFKAGSMKSVCMHGGGIVSSQTTGSMVVQLKDGDITLWTTGTSLPCISLYKPYWFTKSREMFFSEEEQHKAVENWKKIEKLHRSILSGEVTELASLIDERDKIESEFFKLAAQVRTEEDKIEAMSYAQKAEEKFYRELIDNLSVISKKSKRFNSNLYYGWYWKRQNNTLGS
ncbi:C69 family dipeptidase [Lutispora saccharofermentans]|uniref:Dipeptidase n=1 Tax=Lutispora saccharofermentans TaxID=3024236 RepID=A0ABT1NB62_9FIRM|nr:C69 family dipeptidase [Lutispora saccharofermentans]MCQ1528279.1 C69 family dipeptidase [Lutispora saccharofermentans]